MQLHFVATLLAASISLTTCADYAPSMNPYLVEDETIVTTDSYVHYTTVKQLPNDDVFTVEKYCFTGQGDQVYTVEIPLGGTTATVDYLDEEQVWHSLSMDDEMPIAPLYITTDETSWLIEAAYHYVDAGSASLSEVVSLSTPAQLTATDEGVICTLTMSNVADVEVHFWTLQSEETLLDLTNETTRFIWSGYLTRQEQRYGYDGYYFKTPSSYSPYSETMFWRNPSAYGPTSFTLTGGSRASDDLSYAWMDTIVDNQEPEGYWLTYPKSVTFLYDSYGMEGGFYDTRFNTDITETLFVAYEKTGDPQFLEAAIGQLDFFVDYAYSHNYYFEVDGTVGILVEDYYHPTDDYAKTHCSLNHHLAEIYTLYVGYEQTGDLAYLTLADTMLAGVELTCDRWVMADHGLEYAYMNDGTMGLVDYPYLTYNDLFAVQYKREQMGLARSEALDYLMSEKKIQMDATGITGYRK